MWSEQGSSLIENLLRPAAYPHPTEAIRLLETHISWVILTGRYAYKIKKPVNFGFVDFSTLERRHMFCNEELRLNRRFAPGIYLDVVPITATEKGARIEGEGKAIEYAVKMQQFDQDGTLDALMQSGGLRGVHFDQLAEELADFHRTAERSESNNAWGRPEAVRAAVEQNFHHLLRAAASTQEQIQLQRLMEWSRLRYVHIAPLLEQRRKDGFVRECHGDLHLCNLVLIADRPVPFDCLEFNPELRWIDVASEIAFLGMDLEVRGNTEIAYRFLNRYEAAFGDYAGLRLWDFYRMYRAMVRAKVIRLTMEDTSDPEQLSRLARDYQRYLDFGTGLLDLARPSLVITHGLSGSGKSHLATELAERLPAIWLRSDIERKRISGLCTGENTVAAPSTNLYGAETTRRTYERLRDLARMLLTTGLSVIVDATFLYRWQREQQFVLAKEVNVSFWILDMQAPLPILEQRIMRRGLAGTDPSEATRAVLAHQRSSREPLSDRERTHTLAVDGQYPDIAMLAAHIASRRASPESDR